MDKLFGRGVGMLVFVGGVGFVAIGEFDIDGTGVECGCVFGGFGAENLRWYRSATFCSIISPLLKFKHTVSPVSGLNELSASGLMRSPFNDVSPFHFSLSL